ncbi:hypothetical protein F5J12DRAFT_781683 [Pisolithus orientalis]|uniref:uncharacterized protein n=1 Tax=Pisolithus orientalis TaxID=936130 RepID=UPI0022241307|nr:uncharacterized protein F5J12DRAFT_781683 [Pisolithus orientalis]KAI6010665.1 hypothetical protein F5J12DRAFT_781683 [Pisolithus orientalis]
MASSEGQKAERSGRLALDKSREGVEGWDWPSPGLRAAPKVCRGPETNIRGPGGQMSDVIPVSMGWSAGMTEGDQPGVRGSSGELTEVSLVVEASSGASPEGNSNLEVGSGMNPESGKNEWKTGVRSEGMDALSFNH